MIKIIIADDHSFIREGIKKVLEGETDMKIYSGVSTGTELLESLDKGDFDIVLLDINLPDRHGLDILRDIRIRFPDVKVLVLSMYKQHDLAVRAIRGGASGYITKDSVPDILPQAIRNVAGGRTYVSPDLADKIISSVREESGRMPHEKLSNREFQVICLIAGGKTVGQIAEQLGLSVKTVSTHRAHILEKMDMKSNAELVRYAVVNGLVC
jgi:DNA-binding NarL/FixJ family response regulator